MPVDDGYLFNNKRLPKSGSTMDFGVEEIAELEKCRDDLFYFAENYFFIVHPDRGREKINLYEPQQRVLRKISEVQRTIILASRQLGKTTLLTVYALWYALFNKDKHIYLLANKETTAKELLDRVKLAFEELPNWLKGGATTFTAFTLALENGSSIHISTTSPDAIRGKTVNLLILDEFAFIRQEIAEEFYRAVAPTISASKTAKIVTISTPNGTGNKFHELYKDSFKSSDEEEPPKNWNEWYGEKIHWSEIPDRDEDWVKSAKAALNNDQDSWDQEYNLVFLDSGSASVNLALLAQLREDCHAPMMTFENEQYKIWKAPEKGRIYTIGVDVSEGVGADASVAQIMDITDPMDIEQVAQVYTRSMQPYVFAELLARIIPSWGKPYMAIERNGPGGQVIDALIEVHKYYNIIDYTKKSDLNPTIRGLFCNTNTKYTGVQNFKYYTEQVEAITFRDKDTIDEIETFRRKAAGKGTWAAQKGKNDDRVMSLVWALFPLEKDICQRYFKVLESDAIGKPIRIHDTNQGALGEYKGMQDHDGNIPMIRQSISFGGGMSTNHEFAGPAESMIKQGWSFV